MIIQLLLIILYTLIIYSLSLLSISFIIYYPYIKYMFKIKEWKTVDKDLVRIKTNEKNTLIKDKNENKFFFYADQDLTILENSFLTKFGILPYLLYKFYEKQIK